MSDPRRTWEGMMARCYRPSNKKYHRYGGRGIKVCARWHTYQNFLADMGARPQGKTLNRIDNDGDYSPENCEWSDHFIQARNRSDNHLVTWNGQTKCIAEWAEDLGINRTTLRNRILRGWPLDVALSTPLDRRFSRCKR